MINLSLIDTALSPTLPHVQMCVSSCQDEDEREDDTDTSSDEKDTDDNDTSAALEGWFSLMWVEVWATYVSCLLFAILSSLSSLCNCSIRHRVW